ncbi:hypothetical protein [Streptomyces abikoensis]
MSTTVAPRLQHPVHADPFLALNYRFPDGEEHELQALRAAPLLEARQRVALTLLALGTLHAGVAEDMGITRQELQRMQQAASRVLRVPGRTPALIHAAYQHPAFPLPAPARGERPELTPGELNVLSSYAAALPLRKLHQPYVVTRKQVAHDQTYLMAKLNARTPGHAIRRAWQLGIYARPGKTGEARARHQAGVRRAAAAGPGPARAVP